MTILEFADVIDQGIKIRYCPNQDGRFYATFESGEVKDGCCLVGSFGNGTSPSEAINEYANEIAGETIVFHARSKDMRKEFVAPKTFDMIGA